MRPDFIRFSNVSKRFGHGANSLQALSDVSLHAAEGRTMAVVGESGSGKTTLGRLLLGIETTTEGEIHVAGKAVTGHRSLSDRRNVQVVQQNPYLTLNPARTIAQTMELPLRLHFGLRGRKARTRIAELLELVGVAPDLADRRPRSLSGGQRQRIALARALACEPRVIVLDEPTSALDVSVQARILRLLVDLQEQLGLTYFFITHDLAVAKTLATSVAVIYRGHLVEFGDAEKVLAHPAHPYTANLLASVPVTSDEEERLKPEVAWREDDGSEEAAGGGCVFRVHCWRTLPACAIAPPLETIGIHHAAACYNHLPAPSDGWRRKAATDQTLTTILPR